MLQDVDQEKILKSSWIHLENAILGQHKCFRGYV